MLLLLRPLTSTTPRQAFRRIALLILHFVCLHAKTRVYVMETGVSPHFCAGSTRDSRLSAPLAFCIAKHRAGPY